MSESADPSPHSFVPPRRSAASGSGDGWVEDGKGAKFWGRFGAAGLLAHDPSRGILLQHRANWSHFGGTWGLPGGARHEHETPVQGAVREASEEAGVVVSSLRLAFTSTLDLGFWSYTTVVAHVTTAFEAAVTDAESIDVRWIPIEEVDALPLHPGFGASWPTLRAELARRTILIVDAANVVGSRPDGWWKDRLGATERLAAELQPLVDAGFPAAALGFDAPHTHWWPETFLVVEGQARGARLHAPDHTAAPGARGDIAGRLEILPADRDGDQTIVDVVAAVFASGDLPSPAGVTSPAPSSAGVDAPAATSGTPRIFVVTADRELSARVTALGAEVFGPSWLLRRLP